MINSYFVLNADLNALHTCCVGGAFLGPPGLGGDNRGLSKPLDNQSFLTGGGTGVVTVAIDTSPRQSRK